LTVLFTVSSTSGEIIDEFTEAPSGSLVVSTGWTHAQAFSVTDSPTMTEVVLNLERDEGSTGSVIVQIRSSDADGDPSASVIVTMSCAVSEIPTDTAKWVSFEPAAPQALSAGKYWIVCKVSGGSDAEIDWQVKGGNPNGVGHDTMTSFDGGSTWTVLQASDANFRVFGTRTPKTTTTTVVAKPSTVAVNGVCTIEVTVVDSDTNSVQGQGTVTLTKDGGTFGSDEVTLEDGTASTTWTAPGSLGSYTITADFNDYSFAGIVYQDSNDDTSITVVAKTCSTVTDLTLSPNSTTTRSTINISVSIVDGNSLPVPDGNVTFTCNTGSFADNPADVSGGSASTTWTAGNSTGEFTITANYSGYDGGTVKYGESSDSNDVTVDYTDVNTTTYVAVSPQYPYKNGSTYVLVEVKDGGSVYVPGGTVELSCTSGTFDNNSITLQGGKGYTKWHAPSTAGGRTIYATYQQHTGRGNRYLTSSDNCTALVVRDTDNTKGKLSWFSQWVSDYSCCSWLSSLPLSEPQSRGFTNTLTLSAGWCGDEHRNSGARADYMKSVWPGDEDGYMDKHDIVWYNGHGYPWCVTFTDPWYERDLGYSEALDAWGDKDTEWVALKTCQVMSMHPFWADTMDGVHLECGFHTNAESSDTYGQEFAKFMIKDSVYHQAHRVHQAWFLAADATHGTDKKQRVIGESKAMFDDHLWGQGYVNDDPSDDGWYWAVDHDVKDMCSPVAVSGGPYDVNVGETVQFDGSGSFDPDGGDYLFYVWDLNTAANTDSNDWDNSGLDSAWDDADLWGVMPTWVFDTAATYNIRLMVIDDDWHLASDYNTVTVNPGGPPKKAGDGVIVLSDGNEIEIVDNYPGLPNEVQLPLVLMVGTVMGYNEMMEVADYYGMEGSAGVDDSGNWTWVDGDNDLIINRYTGAVMYVDREKAYVHWTDPCDLPDDAEAIAVADAFLNGNGISRDGAVVDGVTDILRLEGEKGERTPTSRVSFQRRVNYRRTISYMGTPYPVVGPGGKIIVLMDEYRDVIMFVKVWRHAYTDMEVPLYPPVQAISDFHRLAEKALIGNSLIPPCKRIEIDNVAVGYYEDDFVTQQTMILPVYILDLTCQDDKGEKQVQVYMSAVTQPLEVTIEEPNAAVDVNYGEAVTFTSSVVGGAAPYTYEWESDVDGLLTTDANFVTSSLSVRYLSNGCVCDVLPHSISLKVTDSYGFETTEFIQVTVHGLCADFDRDDTVNLVDYERLAACWLAEIGDSGYDEKADFDADSIVDMKDLCVLTGEWLQ